MTKSTTGLSIIEQWHQACEWTLLLPVVLLTRGDLRSTHPRRTLSLKGASAASFAQHQVELRYHVLRFHPDRDREHHIKDDLKWPGTIRRFWTSCGTGRRRVSVPPATVTETAWAAAAHGHSRPTTGNHKPARALVVYQALLGHRPVSVRPGLRLLQNCRRNCMRQDPRPADNGNPEASALPASPSSIRSNGRLSPCPWSRPTPPRCSCPQASPAVSGQGRDRADRIGR